MSIYNRWQSTQHSEIPEPDYSQVQESWMDKHPKTINVTICICFLLLIIDLIRRIALI